MKNCDLWSTQTEQTLFLIEQHCIHMEGLLLHGWMSLPFCWLKEEISLQWNTQDNTLQWKLKVNLTATTTKKTRGKQIYCTSTLESTREKLKVRFSQSPHSHFGEQIQLLDYNFPAIDGATIYVACNGMKTLTANHLNLWERFTFIKVNSFSIPLNCSVTELMKTRIINLIFCSTWSVWYKSTKLAHFGKTKT